MKNNIKNVHFLTSKQVSKYLFIPLRTVQRLTKEGKIKGVKIGKQWRYKRADIEYYISRGTDFSREPERIPDNSSSLRANFVSEAVSDKNHEIASSSAKFIPIPPDITPRNDFSSRPVLHKGTGFIERRAFPRINSNIKCGYSVNLVPFKDTNNAAIIKNLSAGGAALVIQDEEINKIEIGDPINLDFDLTRKTETLNIKTEGRIVRKDGGRIGVKFRNIDEETRNKIIQYVG